MIIFNLEIAIGALLLAMIYHWLVGRSKKRRIAFISFFAFTLTVLSLSALNAPGNLNNGYVDLEIKFLASKDQPKLEDAKAFLSENFILINNAFDKQLLTAAGPGRGLSAVEAVTNRKSVRRFLEWCKININDIDFIICDIGFDDRDTSINHFLPFFDDFGRKGKLIVSDNEQPHSIARILPAKARGLTTAENSDGRFNAQTLISSGEASLAYLVYQKMDTVKRHGREYLGIFQEIKNNSRKQWCLNTFPPVLYINDGIARLADKDTLQELSPGLTVRKNGNYYSLNNLDLNELTGLLKVRRSQGKKNILLLGTFEGTDDLHHTIFGDLHGSAIILNMIYNLHTGGHAIGIRLLIIQLLGFFLLGYLIIFGCLIGYDKKERKRLSEFTEREKRAYRIFTGWQLTLSRRSLQMWMIIIDFILEYIFLIVLVFIVWLAYETCHVLLNIIGLTTGLLLFRSFFISFLKLKKIKS